MDEFENGAIDRRAVGERYRRGRVRGPRLRGRYIAKRRRDRDAYAATIATLVGLLALGVSGYTAYVQRQQLRAQVWPYLFVGTANVPPFVGFHAINSGTGPARVIAVGVQVDKQFVRDWAHADPAVDDQVRVVMSQLSNSVLPAGKDLTYFGPYDQASSEPFIELFLGKKHEIQVTICYCSVLDDCWVASRKTVPVAIADADACPIAEADRFKR